MASGVASEEVMTAVGTSVEPMALATEPVGSKAAGECKVGVAGLAVAESTAASVV